MLVLRTWMTKHRFRSSPFVGFSSIHLALEKMSRHFCADVAIGLVDINSVLEFPDDLFG